jgi:glyoxylase-like metal-dependent hydrolase (beta-lactamase superfamily II)
VGVIVHPKAGVVLFDTGYSEHFRSATSRFPYTIVPRVTPVTFEAGQGAADQLRARGIAPESVTTVLLSHFHPDHIGGARDFPAARFVCYQDAYRQIRGKRGLSALMDGYVPELLPADFESRVVFAEDRPLIDISEHFGPFEQGVDLFGDGGVVLVPLPGHAHGHYGVIVATEPAATFLIADACWVSAGFRENRMPHRVAQWIFSDARAYRATLAKLHALHRDRPTLAILPAHCEEVFSAYVTGAKAPAH